MKQTISEDGSFFKERGSFHEDSITRRLFVSPRGQRAAKVEGHLLGVNFSPYVPDGSRFQRPWNLDCTPDL
jgi:hypothetical protein